MHKYSLVSDTYRL